MESQSLTELASHFNDKLSLLKTVCELRQVGDDTECNKYLIKINTELESLEITMAMLRKEVSKQKEQLKSVKGLKTSFEKLINNVNYTSNNIPARLPVNNNTDTDSERQPNKTTANCNKEKKIEPTPVKKQSTAKKHCPDIEYLTVEEFEEAPKYMKGRVTYNQMNSVVEELNKSFTAKYKIMRMKRSAMNDVSRKRFENYKLQETKDTQGVYFIVEDDIKEFTSIKMDAVTRAIITTLRHCGRLREIRGGKITRFAIIESY